MLSKAEWNKSVRILFGRPDEESTLTLSESGPRIVYIMHLEKQRSYLVTFFRFNESQVLKQPLFCFDTPFIILARKQDDLIVLTVSCICQLQGEDWPSRTSCCPSLTSILFGLHWPRLGVLYHWPPNFLAKLNLHQTKSSSVDVGKQVPWPSRTSSKPTLLVQNRGRRDLQLNCL